ncbi:hypothetical protein DFH07DRAFT_832963 [Mycena maculata]|uniref:Uncharacterized protein n=1 Tax=Mycena maculata TaxID=230809 RepID=A0AAD7N5C4_9AGAR|nr:hypothetical protein DFH07DRAFT_832963 [Mycena maculata]
MSIAMLRLLFPCCIRSPKHADDSTVIPTETSHLISASALSSPGLPETITVDHQKLNDRLGTIVRAKEGKMVNLSLRSPFTLQSVGGSTPTSPTAESSPATTATVTSQPAPLPAPIASRRPPVLTMTPARSRASFNLYADSRSSSPAGSRSSSRRRTDPVERDRYRYSAPPSAFEEGKAKRKASEWFGETESELSVAEPDDEPPVSAPVTIVRPKEDSDSITFSWSDT